MKNNYWVSAVMLAGVLTSADAALIAHWRFDDVSGSNAFASVGSVNGTLVGGVSFKPTEGVRDGALQITDGYVDMGNNFPCRSTFSVHAWVKLQAGSMSGMIPVAKHWATRMEGYLLSINDIGDGVTQSNTAGFYTANGAYKTAFGGPAVNDGNWHQLVGTYNNGVTNIYIDGKLAGNGSAGCADNAAHFMIGGYFNSVGKPVNSFKGLVDEVQIYDSALSASEVNALYTNIPSSSTSDNDCWATYENGSLYIPCVKVKVPFSGDLKYAVTMQYKPLSEPMSFELKGAQPK